MIGQKMNKTTQFKPSTYIPLFLKIHQNFRKKSLQFSIQQSIKIFEIYKFRYYIKIFIFEKGETKILKQKNI